MKPIEPEFEVKKHNWAMSNKSNTLLDQLVDKVHFEKKKLIYDPLFCTQTCKHTISIQTLATTKNENSIAKIVIQRGT